MGNARFSREKAYVSVDTRSMNALSKSQTFDIFVDHDSRHRGDCYLEWRR